MRTLHSCHLWHGHLAELIFCLCIQGLPSHCRVDVEWTVQKNQHSCPHEQGWLNREASSRLRSQGVGNRAQLEGRESGGCGTEKRGEPCLWAEIRG